MKILKSYFLCFYLLILGCSNKATTIDLSELNPNNPYLIFRGTQTKEGFFAKSFNIKDSLNSHVAFLIHNKNWEVYHVSNFSDGFSDLRVQDLEDFLYSNEDKVINSSIWRFNNTSLEEKNKINSTINSLINNYIEFDKSFDLSEQKLYCSEFVVNTLKKVDSKKYNILPIKKKLQGIYKTYFKKDTLEYYPVDIFHYNYNFSKVLDFSLNQ